MRMEDEERLSGIDRILDELSILAEDHVILIEGLRDVRALDNLGISGDVFAVQAGGGPMKAAEYVMEHGGKAVVLTDWDRTGERIASDLERQLSALGLECDLGIRRKLHVFCRRFISDMESLDSLVERLQATRKSI